MASVCFSSDGMLSGSGDNTARVWDAISGKSLFPPLTGHTNDIYSICLFPGGRRFTTGFKDGAIRIWSLNTIPNDTNWELRDDNCVFGEDDKLMIWIPKHLHTYLYGPRNISILNHSFFVKIHFGPNGILGRIYSFHISIFLLYLPYIV